MALLRYLSVVTMVVATLALSGCITRAPLVAPDWTTYPIGKVETKPVSMWVAPSFSFNTGTKITTSKTGKPIYERKSRGSHSLTYDFDMIRRGDTAEREVFIRSSAVRNKTERALLRMVAPRGKAVCKGQYRVAESKFYTGHEATVKMMGIAGPSLKVRYRCPAQIKDEHKKASRSIRDVASVYPDQVYFDVLSKTYPLSVEALMTVVRAASDRAGMPVIREGRTTNGRYIRAGKAPDERRWGRIEQLAALVEEQDSGASVTFILLTYQITYHRRGDRNEILGVAPYNRRQSFRIALEFLSDIEEKIYGKN